MRITPMLSSLLLTMTPLACVAPEPVPPPDETVVPLPEGLPGADELTLSPRADGRAEAAALVVDRDRWVASDATVARTAADFAAIAAALPGVQFSIDDKAPRGVNGDWLYAPDDADVAARIDSARDVVSGIADALGGALVEDGDHSFSAQWSARLQPAFIRETFAGIDAVATVSAGRDYTHDGPTIASEQFDVDGKTVWLMLNFGGDCPEGCTELQASRVRVEKDGDALVVDLLGSFDSTAGDACPQWLSVRPGVCERYGP